MPVRNTIKPNVPDVYYHVYARGASKKEVFLDFEDYQFFLSLFARYLSLEKQSSRLTSYKHLRGKIELNCFCLMPNHFHLLIYQIEQDAMSTLMRGVMTSYSSYFNRKYKQTGSLFETRYKASHIDNEAYLAHISRYIHLNPRYYQRYPYSSYKYFLTDDAPEWLQTGRIKDMFASTTHYKDFVADYEDSKTMLDIIKKQLAE